MTSPDFVVKTTALVTLLQDARAAAERLDAAIHATPTPNRSYIAGFLGCVGSLAEWIEEWTQAMTAANGTARDFPTTITPGGDELSRLRDDLLAKVVAAGEMLSEVVNHLATEDLATMACARLAGRLSGLLHLLRINTTEKHERLFHADELAVRERREAEGQH